MNKYGFMARGQWISGSAVLIRILKRYSMSTIKLLDHVNLRYITVLIEMTVDPKTL